MPTTPHRTKTLRSLTGMIAHVSDLREEIERDVVVGKLVPSLERIFGRAERALAAESRAFRQLKTTSAGKIIRSTANVERGLKIVDGLVNFVGWIVQAFGRVFRHVQTGQLQHYALYFILATFAMVCVFLLGR